MASYLSYHVENEGDDERRVAAFYCCSCTSVALQQKSVIMPVNKRFLWLYRVCDAHTFRHIIRRSLRIRILG